MITSITPFTFKQMISLWALAVKNEGYGSFFLISKEEQLRRINQLITNKGLVKQYFPNYELIVLDLTSLTISDANDLDDFISKIKSKRRKIFFVVDCIKMFEEKNLPLITAFQDLTIFRKDCSFLFFFSKDFINPIFSSIFLYSNFLLENVFFHPLYKKGDCYQFIRHLKEKFNINVDKEISKEIVDKCGGNLTLIKQATRGIRDKLPNIYNNDQMKLRLDIVWNRFLPSEKEVLKKIAKGNFDFNEIEIHSFNFLKKIKIIQEKNNQHKISIPILENYIKDEINKIVFEIDKKNNLFINNVLVNNLFSKKEKDLLIFFLNNKKKVVSRDQAAEILWGPDTYSDWALDQNIYRLRKKLNKILPLIKLKTKKNSGFFISF